MIRLLLKPALMVTALLALTVMMMRAAPYEDAPLVAFVAGPDHCAGNCLLGIQPGRSRVSDAITLLNNHPWVDSYTMNANGRGYAQIRWQWSNLQPEFIDPSYPGRITFYWDVEEDYTPSVNEVVIQTIAITTFVPMDHLLRNYGPPDSGSTGFRPDMDLGYSAAFNVSSSTLMLSTVLPCPVNLMTYWHAPAKITISSQRGASSYVSPGQMARRC